MYQDEKSRDPGTIGAFSGSNSKQDFTFPVMKATGTQECDGVTSTLSGDWMAFPRVCCISHVRQVQNRSY